MSNKLLNSVANPHAFMDELCRRDLVTFFLRAFPEIRGGGRITPNWHLDAIACQLEQVRSGHRRNLLINLPPRHLKTMMVSVAWVAWMLGHNPKLNFVCVSYANELSLKQARDCRAIMQTPWYRRLFPNTRIRHDRSAAHDFETSAGGGRLSTSVTGTLTGRGGDYIIIDDPIKPDEAASELVREAVNDWYFSTCDSRLDNPTGGGIIVVMQRLHQYDLAGMLIERSWPLLSLPAIAPEASTIQLTRGRFYHRAEGEPLQPARMPLEELRRKERDLGSRLFAAQWQQDPVPAKGNIIKALWLLQYLIAPARTGSDYIVQSWDTASKADERNDYSVCVTALVRGRKVYLLDVWRGKVEFSELWKKVQELARTWNPRALLVEDTGNGTALISRLRNDAPKGVPSPIEIKPRIDKVGRLEAASTMIEAGDLIIPKEAPWLAIFKSELLGFPSVRHDDQVDALSQLMNWVDGKHRFKSTVGAGPVHFDRSGSGTGSARESREAFLDAWLPK